MFFKMHALNIPTFFLSHKKVHLKNQTIGIIFNVGPSPRCSRNPMFGVILRKKVRIIIGIIKKSVWVYVNILNTAISAFAIKRAGKILVPIPFET